MEVSVLKPLIRRFLLGSVPIAGQKVEYEPLEVQEDSRWYSDYKLIVSLCLIKLINYRFSDFEEDHDIHHHDPIICEVKNDDLCDTIEEDDFEEVLLEVDLLTESAATDTQPDLLNKTFT